MAGLEELWEQGCVCLKGSFLLAAIRGNLKVGTGMKVAHGVNTTSGCSGGRQAALASHLSMCSWVRVSPDVFILCQPQH